MLRGQTYAVSTLAGVPPGHDGSGTEVDFGAPEAVATDASGNVYVADTGDHTIRQIRPDGSTITVAGLAGVSGFVDGNGADARFSGPAGIVVTRDGVIYVADTENHTIRRIEPGGTVTTLAGAAGAYGVEDGSGSSARFHNPRGLVIDSDGNLFVADWQNNSIRKVTPAGEVTTFAGKTGFGGAADGAGPIARFQGPVGVGLDGDGNVFVTDSVNNTIRKITPTGIVSTLAGQAGTAGSTDGTGAVARFFGPSGIAVDAGGTVFVSDLSSSIVRQVTPGGLVTTLAGNPSANGLLDGDGTAARFHTPRGLALTIDGDLIVADSGNDSIRRVSPAGHVTTLLGRPGDAEGFGSAARFFQPTGVAVNSQGHVFVADRLHMAIRESTPAGDVSTFAHPNVILGGNLPEGLATSATDVLFATYAGSAIIRLTPEGDFVFLANVERGNIAIDLDGNVVVASSSLHTISRLAPDGTVTRLAGAPNQFGAVDGAGDVARFWGPSGVAVDGGGNIYVADTYNATIRKITPTGIVSTLAGSPGESGDIDGVGTAARFRFPVDVAADADGNLFVVDATNFTIRRITPDGVVTTIAGSPGRDGYADGAGSTARFGRNGMGPMGIAVGPDGRIFIADVVNDAIRVLTPLFGPDITSAITASGTYGTDFSYTITAMGTPTSFAAGNLPSGLVVNSASGEISGVPTAAGVFASTISATDASGTREATLTLTIVPAVTLGQAASLQVNGGTASTLKVNVGGGNTNATIRWEFWDSGTWTQLAGATTATLLLPSTQTFHAGSYRALVTIDGATAASEVMSLSVQPPPPNNARLLNLSTRGLTQTGDNILIPGFVIGGSGTKKLLIRAVGPTLSQPPFNIATALDNPRMTLKRLDYSQTPAAYVDVDSNDDWMTNPNAADIDTAINDLFAFPFQDDREAALLVDLAPGQYTVFADGVNNATGVAIVELYDADAPNPAAKLINISNRGFCGVGSEVMIPGFVVSSEGPKTLLIRVVGPTLAGAPFNVPGTMADPKLEIFPAGSGTPILTQDNWGDNPDAAYTAQVASDVSAFALSEGSADAAFVVTLPPGTYSVVGSSADRTSTGVVLVEVYVVP